MQEALDFKDFQVTLDSVVLRDQMVTLVLQGTPELKANLEHSETQEVQVILEPLVYPGPLGHLVFKA